jgi:hypothetical protein
MSAWLEAVGSGQRALAVHERQPREGAVGGELRHVERALVEQVHVRRAIVRLERALGHELVDVVEALVVAEVEDDAPVLRDDRLGAFVLEAAEGAFFGTNGSTSTSTIQPPPGSFGSWKCRTGPRNPTGRAWGPQRLWLSVLGGPPAVAGK